MIAVNASEVRGHVRTGPYFYLPKMQSHLEARLWNDVFVEAQAELGVPRGSIRVSTSLIEALLCISMALLPDKY